MVKKLAGRSVSTGPGGLCRSTPHNISRPLLARNRKPLCRRPCEASDNLTTFPTVAFCNTIVFARIPRTYNYRTRVAAARRGRNAHVNNNNNIAGVYLHTSGGRSSWSGVVPYVLRRYHTKRKHKHTRACTHTVDGRIFLSTTAAYTRRRRFNRVPGNASGKSVRAPNSQVKSYGRIEICTRKQWAPDKNKASAGIFSVGIELSSVIVDVTRKIFVHQANELKTQNNTDTFAK